MADDATEPDDDDDEYIPRPECPVCGTLISTQEWRDGIFGGSYRVETLDRCPAGHYERHDSYGAYTATVGDRRWSWSHTTPPEESQAIEAEIEQAVEALTRDR